MDGSMTNAPVPVTEPTIVQNRKVAISFGHPLAPLQIERHDFQRPRVGCGQFDVWRATFVVSLKETGGAETPAVTWLQAGKAGTRGRRCGKIIPDVFRVGEEFGCHDGADCVAAAVFHAGVAMAVVEETGQWRS